MCCNKEIKKLKYEINRIEYSKRRLRKSALMWGARNSKKFKNKIDYIYKIWTQLEMQQGLKKHLMLTKGQIYGFLTE